MASGYKMPKFNERIGSWRGGDSHTLYAFTDKRTHVTTVHPGTRLSMRSVDPEVTVRIATRKEGEDLWQNPLNEGWKVEENYKIGSSTREYDRLLRRVVPSPERKFALSEHDSLTRAIGQAYRAKKISGEERDLLKAFLDARS